MKTLGNDLVCTQFKLQSGFISALHDIIAVTLVTKNNKLRIGHCINITSKVADKLLNVFAGKSKDQDLHCMCTI